MTAALEGGEWSASRPGHTLPPGKTRYPFYRRLGGPQGWSGRAENLVPTHSQLLYWRNYPAHLYKEYILKIVFLFDFRMTKSLMQNCHQCMAHQL